MCSYIIYTSKRLEACALLVGSSSSDHMRYLLMDKKSEDTLRHWYKGYDRHHILSRRYSCEHALNRMYLPHEAHMILHTSLDQFIEMYGYDLGRALLDRDNNIMHLYNQGYLSH